MKTIQFETKIDGLTIVQDVDETIKYLKNGETVARCEFGDSMLPIFKSGQYARLTPCYNNPNIGDAVFCCVNGVWMIHLVWMVNKPSKQCLIGDTSGNMYGWTSEILAIATPMNYIQQTFFIKNE